jgi:hypothetical protein
MFRQLTKPRGPLRLSFPERLPFVLAVRQKCTTEPQPRRAGYLQVDISKQQVARLMLRAT